MGYIYNILEKNDRFMQFSAKETNGLSRNLGDISLAAQNFNLKQFPDVLKEIYILKENLSVLLSESNQKVYAFTSPHAGEGVTTIVSHLAFVWAKSFVSVPGDLNLSPKRKVLVIDANRQSPQLHAHFKIEQASGLSDFLSGAAPLDRVVRTVVGKNLYIITAGGANDLDEEIFSSPRFARLLQKLEEKFDVILVDTPPILNSSESIPLAKAFKNYILVINSQKTRTSIAQKAVERLLFYHASVKGIVMNQRRFYVPDTLYKKL
jgi:protein-tyrosine kinase